MPRSCGSVPSVPTRRRIRLCYAQCKAWAKKLDDSHKEILGTTQRLDGPQERAFADMQQWDEDTAAAEKLVNYFQFSLGNLERSGSAF